MIQAANGMLLFGTPENETYGGGGGAWRNLKVFFRNKSCFYSNCTCQLSHLFCED